MSSEEAKKRSGAWYLLPILLTVVGGVIAYFVIKEDDPKKAKNCLYLGITLTGIGIMFAIVSGATLASEMENSPFFDEGFKNSENNFVNLSEMSISDKSKINKLAEDIEYDYNSYGLKLNYIQLQDENGNNVTTVDSDSLYVIVGEVQNRDNIEKAFLYDILSVDERGIGGGGGSDVIIAPYGTVLINDGWSKRAPGVHEVEINIEDMDSDISNDPAPFWRVLHLEEE